MNVTTLLQKLLFEIYIECFPCICTQLFVLCIIAHISAHLFLIRDQQIEKRPQRFIFLRANYHIQFNLIIYSFLYDHYHAGKLLNGTIHLKMISECLLLVLRLTFVAAFWRSM